MSRFSDYQEVMLTYAEVLESEGVQLKNGTNFVNVTCYYNYTKPYQNIHWFVPKYNKLENDKISVFVLVNESMSGLSYLRWLKKTQEVFAELGHF